MSEAYGFFAPGVSGATDDFEQAMEWLKNERKQFRESGAEGAIYIRLDLAVSMPTDALDRLFEAAQNAAP